MQCGDNELIGKNMYLALLSLLLQKPSPSRVESRIRELLTHAYHEVPYYHQIMQEAGVKPEDFISLQDFVNGFPTTNAADYKKVMLEDENRVLSSSLLPSLKHTDRSSGSTGIPITVHRNNKEHAHNNAKTILHLIKSGLRPWHRTAAIVPPIQVVEHDSILQRMGIFYRKTIDHYLPVNEAVDLIASLKINAIYGRKAGIQLLAEQVANRSDIRPFAFLMPGAEVIDKNARRYLIDKYRPEKYAEMYGCTETGIIATRNDELPYDIDYSSVFVSLENVEALDDGTHRGEVVITSLYNFLQPFLKYKLGDIVVVSDYEKLYELKMKIVDIEGRADDFLYLKNGDKLSAARFKCALEVFHYVWQYKIIQTSYEHCEIYVVLTENNPSRQAEIKKAIDNLIGSDINYKLEFVDEIKPGKGGKFKILESTINKS